MPTYSVLEVGKQKGVGIFIISDCTFLHLLLSCIWRVVACSIDGMKTHDDKIDKIRKRERVGGTWGEGLREKERSREREGEIGGERKGGTLTI